MKNFLKIFTIISLLFIVGCNESDNDVNSKKEDDIKIISFKFLAKNNPELDKDYEAIINSEDNSISIELPELKNRNLIATIETPNGVSTSPLDEPKDPNGVSTSPNDTTENPNGVSTSPKVIVGTHNNIAASSITKTDNSLIISKNFFVKEGVFVRVYGLQMTFKKEVDQ